jgi:hypothetical protein
VLAEVQPKQRAHSNLAGAAFGIAIEAAPPLALPGLAPAAAGLLRTHIELVDARSLERSWPAHEVQRTVDLRYPNGSLMMCVERHRSSGYRVYAPRYGRHIVSDDGTAIRSALPALAPARSRRLLFAQVLPLAAALQGLEVLHASAVVLGGRAFAFFAASGTGKTSIAAHLVARGGSLLTDDVLALEPCGELVVAHPGAPTMNLDPLQLAAVDSGRRARLGPAVGRTDKVHLQPPLHPTAVPLAALCFLRRGSTLSVERRANPSARELLGTSFVSHLQTPARLLAHLEVSSRIAESLPTFTVDLPRGGSAETAAVALEGALMQELA